jgi:ribosome-binding protein aMBF1 (putative translation factor)
MFPQVLTLVFTLVYTKGVMEIKDALTLAQKEVGWSDEQLAVIAQATSTSVKRWKNGESIPSGDALIALQRNLPKFSELMLGKAVA